MSSQVEEALARCAEEPIHIPGAIQPFGILFALDDELRIRQCSQNAFALLSRQPDDLFGRPISELIAVDLREHLKDDDFDIGEPLQIRLPNGAGDGYVFLHRRTGRLIVEIEFAGTQAAPASAAWMRTAFTRAPGGMVGIWQHDGGERHAPAPVTCVSRGGQASTRRRSGPM